MTTGIGYASRTNEQRDIQPVAIVAVDPITRKAKALTRIYTEIEIDCRIPVGSTYVIPAVGEQWYVDRYDLVWHLHSRLPFNDNNTLIEPVPGQMVIGGTGPVELNGSQLNVHGDTTINGTLGVGDVTLKDVDGMLQQSTDGGETFTPIGTGGGDGEGGGPSDIDDVTGLTEALEAKSNVGHTHTTYTDPLTTKGDLLARTATTTVRKPVGAPGSWLRVSPAQTDGLVWAVMTANDIPDLNASKITSGEFPQAMVDGLTEALATTLKTDSPLDAHALYNLIPPHLLAQVPVSVIGDTQTNLISDPHFQSASLLSGAGIWFYDAAVGHVMPGSARTTADGTTKELLTQFPIPVSAGQVLAISGWTKWSGLVGTSEPVQLAITGYNANGSAIDQVTIASHSTAPPTTDWIQLSGSYTVATGVVSMRVRLVVAHFATAGTVWFDDLSAIKTQLLSQRLVAGTNSGTTLADDITNLTVGVATNASGLTGKAALADFNSLVSTIGGTFGTTIPAADARLNSFLTPASPLNGSNIASGAVADAFVPGVTTLVDTIVTNALNISGAGFAHVDSATALKANTHALVDVSARLAQLESTVTGGVGTGDGFDRTSASGFGPLWRVSYSGTGGNVATTGHDAVFVPGGNLDREFLAIYNGPVTRSATNLQEVALVLSSMAARASGACGYNDLWLRIADDNLVMPGQIVDITNVTGIRARFGGDGSLSIYRFVNGAGTLLNSEPAGTVVPPGPGSTIIGTAGDPGTDRFFRALIGTAGYLEVSEAGVASGFGPGYQRWGFGGKATGHASGQQKPGDVHQWTARDQVARMSWSTTAVAPPERQYGSGWSTAVAEPTFEPGGGWYIRIERVARFSGVGTLSLSVTTVIYPSKTAAFSATGALSATVVSRRAITAVFSATGSQITRVFEVQYRTATFSAGTIGPALSANDGLWAVITGGRYAVDGLTATIVGISGLFDGLSAVIVVIEIKEPQVVTLSGTGTLHGVMGLRDTRIAFLTANGTLTVAIQPVATATSAFTGTAALAATLRPALNAALSATGALNAAIGPVYTTPAILTGSGELSATAIHLITAAVSSNGTLTAALDAAFIAAFTSDGELTAITGRTVVSTLTATGALSATMVQVHARTTTDTALGRLTTPAHQIYTITATLSGDAELTVALVQRFSATAIFDSNGSLTTTVAAQLTATGTATGSLAAISSQIYDVAPALSATGALSATVVQVHSTTAAFTATSAPTAAVNPVYAISAALTGGGALSATVVQRFLTTAVFASSGTLITALDAAFTAVLSSAGSFTATYSQIYTVAPASTTTGMLASATLIPCYPDVSVAHSSDGTLTATAFPFDPFTEENVTRTNQPVPLGAGQLEIWLIGKGGKGGSGQGSTSGARNGGGGAGAGARVLATIPASSLGPTYSVTRGTANGAASTFSSGSIVLTANGGGVGISGPSGGGGGVGGTATQSGWPGATLQNGTNGGAKGAAAANNANGAGAGGGGGCSVGTNDNTSGTHGKGGNSATVTAPAGQGATPTAAAAGNGGAGGAGGFPGNPGTGAPGGAGGSYGGGGGGGSACNRAVPVGVGGDGGAGYNRLVWT